MRNACGAWFALPEVRLLTVAGLVLAGFAAQGVAQSGDGYDLTWSTIDSGGAMSSTGNGYELGGTIGQADAGALTGDNGYALTGGFWAAGVPCPCQLFGDLVDVNSLPTPDCQIDVSDLLCMLDDFADPGACQANSDLAIKTNIRGITNAPETILKLRPVAFRYTDEYKSKHTSIKDQDYFNYVAQEFREVFPDWVQDSGEGGLLQMNAYPASIYTVAAIRELHFLMRE